MSEGGSPNCVGGGVDPGGIKSSLKTTGKGAQLGGHFNYEKAKMDNEAGTNSTGSRWGRRRTGQCEKSLRAAAKTATAEGKSLREAAKKKNPQNNV